MESTVTPARIKVGTGFGCSEYSDQERAKLNELLSLPRQMRVSVIHKALRVYCQTLIASEGKGAGYPGALDDVMRLVGVSGHQSNGSVVFGGHPEAAVQHGEVVDRRGSSGPEPVKRVAHEAEGGVQTQARVSEPEPEPESELEPEPEPDEHTEWVKDRMAQFMV